MRIPYRSFSFWLIVVAFTAYVGLGSQMLDKPGLYMDAVNPDYLVVKMVNPTSPTEEWLLPGDLLFGRWPILGGPYSGTYATYFTLPFYLLFGGSLTSLRLAHLAFGLLILAAAALLFRQATRSATIAGAFTLLLAVDPAFIFPFRTQASTSTFPDLPMLLALYILCRYRRPTAYVIAGVALGFATWGYFVFAFPLAGIALFVVLDRDGGERPRRLVALIGGFALGVLPYVIAYALLIGASGTAAGTGLIGGLPGQLHANSGDPYAIRLFAIIRESWTVLTAEWDWQTFFALAGHNDYSQIVKVVVLLLVSVAALPFVRRAGDVGRAFILFALSDASYVLVASLFGQRLGGHDLTAILPLTYAVAATAFAILWSYLKTPSTRSKRAVWVVLLAFVVANVAATQAIFTNLSRNGGAALYSSILSDYPMLEQKRNDRTPHIFWEWGSMLQFIYLTGGEIPAYSRAALPSVLCQYGNAKIVLIGDDAIHPDASIGNLGVNVDETQSLSDSQSGYPLTVVSVSPKGPKCAPPVMTLAPGTRLPEGVMSGGASTVQGLYPDIPATCCLVADRASFDVEVPAGARGLRFEIFVPEEKRMPPKQRITFDISGITTESGELPAGKVSEIEVRLPQRHDQDWVAQVRMTPETSFVPKALGINGDDRRLSVILVRVSSML